MQEIVSQAEVVHAALKQRLILVAGYVLVEIFAAALGVPHLAQYAAVRAGDALDGEIAGVGVETHIHRRRAGQIHILRGNLPVRRKLTNQRFRTDKPAFAVADGDRVNVIHLAAGQPRGFIHITKTYRVYCNSTIEEEKLLKEKMNNTIMVINDTENNLMIDEISGDIIL